VRLPERAALWGLHRLDPEIAHDLSLAALRLGLARRQAPPSSDRLRTRIAGLDLPNPVGLAAGYDKNAVAVGPLLGLGFGFVELGAATPLAQGGNPKPRLFRLPEDRAIINRFGFNNQGAERIAARLATRPGGHGIVGLNLGANKTSPDRPGDYASVLATCGRFVDFVTLNVSSPNTENLRDLQGAAALDVLLSRVLAARNDGFPDLPVFLKIAPDLTDGEIAQIATIARKAGISAIVATNTTLAREGLKSPAKSETGGLSGAPLFKRATRVLARLSQACGPDLPLIGVGGIGSPEDAYTKIKAGASAVQVLSALVYQGTGLPVDIALGLERLLARDGFLNVAEAVGVEADTYA